MFGGVRDLYADDFVILAYVQHDLVGEPSVFPPVARAHPCEGIRDLFCRRNRFSYLIRLPLSSFNSSRQCASIRGIGLGIDRISEAANVERGDETKRRGRLIFDG